MENEIAELAAAEARLKEVIHTIVQRRTAHAERLSWRLIFEIEEEAISLLERDADLDMRYLNMMASPSAQRHAPSGELPGRADLYAMHTALWMIQEAYCHAH